MLPRGRGLAEGDRRRRGGRRAHSRNTGARFGGRRVVNDRWRAALGIGRCIARFESKLRQPQRIRKLWKEETRALPLPDDPACKSACATRMTVWLRQAFFPSRDVLRARCCALPSCSGERGAKGAL